MLQILLSFGAGIATAASPCILPMLPLLLGASAASSNVSEKSNRHRPLFIVLGFVLSFASIAILFGASTHVLGLSHTSLRNGAIVVLGVSGLLLLWPLMFERVMAPFGRFADIANNLGNRAGSGNWGGVFLGMCMGLLWTPCAGPVLASVLTLIATEKDTGQAAASLLAYAVGAGLPMLAIAYGGQAATSRARGMTKYSGAIRKVFGGMVLSTAAAMYWNVDVAAVAWVTRAITIKSSDADSTTQEQHRVDYAAPEFQDVSQWLNSDPITIESLKGKVVLIDFWTFGCINCVNTLPYLTNWYEKYKGQGFEIVGVHTPEFAFERETENVKKAIAAHGIKYPVAQDNKYATWGVWQNKYWPAVYLIDRSGKVVFSHVGEGDYELIERKINDALSSQL